MIVAAGVMREHGDSRRPVKTDPDSSAPDAEILLTVTEGGMAEHKTTGEGRSLIS